MPQCIQKAREFWTESSKIRRNKEFCRQSRHASAPTTMRNHNKKKHRETEIREAPTERALSVFRRPPSRHSLLKQERRKRRARMAPVEAHL